MKVLTFDIEEWFHVLDNDATRDESSWDSFEVRIHKNMDRIFKVLNETNSKATFFCLGWIALKYPDIIHQIDNLGYEVACHSDKHQLVYELTASQFKEDTRIAIERLEHVLGKKVTSYRAPGFSFTKNTLWAFEILHELGIKHDSSVFPALRAHGGYPDFPSKKPIQISYKGITIKELPITTTKLFGQDIVFGGGGYFRLIPYPLIKKWTKEHDYVMTYLHPRDLDACQPMIPGLSLSRKFKSYYGLKNAETKFRKWLTEFEFTDLQTFDKKYDWSKTNQINL